jgi:hypothetical protein
LGVELHGFAKIATWWTISTYSVARLTALMTSETAQDTDKKRTSASRHCTCKHAVFCAKHEQKNTLPSIFTLSSEYYTPVCSVCLLHTDTPIKRQASQHGGQVDVFHCIVDVPVLTALRTKQKGLFPAELS